MSEHTTRREIEVEGPSVPTADAWRPTHATERKLWFGILAGPIAWTLAELIGFAVVGRACEPAGVLSGGQAATVFLVPLAAVALTAGAGLVAYGVFQRSSGPVSFAKAEGWNRVEFMAMAGVIVSGFLLLNIVYFAVMPVLMDPCVQVR